MENTHNKERKVIHPDIIKLGFVSLLTDLSSEMIFSIFAIFFTEIAGASTALLGIVEGLADLASSAPNYLAGWLSDRTGQRKTYALSGYGFSTLAKIIPLFAVSVAALSIFRIVERLGKGFRGPPRDAWLSAVADKSIRGYSFGVHKALDKSGAVLGPLVAYVLLTWLGGNSATYRLLFWVAFIPAIASIVVLSLVKDRPGTYRSRDNMFDTWRELSPAFKRYLLSASIFSLAYFSFSFLLLRAQTVGFAINDIVLLYALFNVSFVLAAPFVGKLGDHIGRGKMIMLSYIIYLLMNIGFAFSTIKWQIVVLFVIYGLFYSIDEAQSKAFIADIEKDRRASAIGIYNFTTGLIYLPASLIAGSLWLLNPSAAFFVSACLTSLAFVSFMFLRPDQ